MSILLAHASPSDHLLQTSRRQVFVHTQVSYSISSITSNNINNNQIRFKTVVNKPPTGVNLVKYNEEQKYGTLYIEHLLIITCLIESAIRTSSKKFA